MPRIPIISSAAWPLVPAAFAKGMVIGQHGSWNRRPHSGYKVIFVAFENGRPVGVALDKQGALLVADDVGNAIWRVSAHTGPLQSKGIP
jgi:glucose/arabinose dehydrogenase